MHRGQGEEEGEDVIEEWMKRCVVCAYAGDPVPSGQGSSLADVYCRRKDKFVPTKAVCKSFEEKVKV